MVPVDRSISPPPGIKSMSYTDRAGELHTTALLNTPSTRTHQYSTTSNTADEMSRQISTDGHKIWGFVIYRCTYSSDADWGEFMSRFRYRIRRTLKFYNAMDMMEKMALTVFEDKTTLDGVSKASVRQRFFEWGIGAPQDEQGTGAGLSQRYRYCIQVDQVCLNSVINDAPAPPEFDHTSKGFVNLVWRDWQPSRRPIMEDDFYEPVEGCREEFVGWMRVDYQNVMVGMYMLLRDESADWYREYQRPPEVATAM